MSPEPRAASRNRLERPSPGPRRLTRFHLEWVLVGLLASMLVAGVARSPLGNPVDRALYDQLVRLNAHRPSDQILIVAIDDVSLADYGPWPWPRTLHAALLDRLTQAGAAAVGYDVLFLEPELHEETSSGDVAFAAALRRSGRTVLPLLQLSPGENGRAVRTLKPIPAFTAAAAGLGQVNIAPDVDGVVRRVSSRVAERGACWPELSLATLRIAEHAGEDRVCAALADASRRTDQLIGSPPELAPFVGGVGRFRSISAAAVMRGDVAPAFVRGKIVLIGVAAAGLGDRYPTASSSLNGGLTGVEVQANLLNAAITGARSRIAAPAAVAAASIALVWLLLVGLTRLGPRTGPWALAALAAVALAASATAFEAGWWASPLPALAGLATAYPLWAWRRLALTSDALGRELARFDAGGGPLAGVGADPLARQMNALFFAAERLRGLHRLLADTLQSLPDATVAVDPQGVIRLANERAVARAGGRDLLGVGLDAWLDAALGERAGRAARAALAAGASAVEAAAADGADFEVGCADVWGLAADRPWRIVRLADISLIRRAMRQREDALQLLTHDIRAPFASISVLALERDPDATTLARIEAYARRGRALAESYVQWSRAENAEVADALFDLRDALIDAADELWPVAERAQVALHSAYPDAEVLVRGDRSLMTRAIINLIDNAVRFSRPGQSVDAVCLVEAAWAVCEVRDRGPGVDPALTPRLFQRFVRSNREGEATGAGLGLAVAALAARRMGGEATYAPRAGGGAVFRLCAPLSRDPGGV